MQSDAEQIDGWWRGRSARTPSQRRTVLLRGAAGHHDVPLARACSSPPLEGRFLGDRRRARPGGPGLVDHEVRRLLRRPDRGRERVRPGWKRLERLRGCGRHRYRVRLHGGGDGARGAAPRSARSRARRRTTAPTRTVGTRATTRPISCFRRSAASRPSKLLDPGRTTTTVIRAAGRTRTLRGSCGSTARRRSRSRSPGPARRPPTCPGSCAGRAARRRGTRGSGWRSARLQVPARGSSGMARHGAARCSASRRESRSPLLAPRSSGCRSPSAGRSRAQLEGGHHVPATLLGGVLRRSPVALTATPAKGWKLRGAACRGAEDVHGADERRHERSRALRRA